MEHCGKRSNDENCIVSNEHDGSKRKKVIVDDLPTEVLAAIFRRLASSSLLLCRLVNHKWNEASSYVMRQRAEIEIVIPFLNGSQKQPLDRNVSNSMVFSDLIGCLVKSQHFPFASFRFKSTDESDNMERFLSIWGANIYELGVEIVVPNDIVMLRGLLLEKAPNLRKLHVNFVHKLSEKPDIHLFDYSSEFQLPKLNVLTVLEMSEKDFGLVGDILKAAPNLISFGSVYECHYTKSLVTNSFKVEEFSMLQSLDKLHCLKRVSLSFDKIFIEFVEKSPQFLNLKFESIGLGMNNIFAQYSSKDAEIINKLFCTSRNSLVELNVSSLGSIPGVELPGFENVEKLTLSHDAHDGRWMFPPHFDMTKSFPNLRELVVDILDKDDYFSTYQPSGVMPNVEFLQIMGDCHYDEKLMKMMPNVKTLVLDGEEGELPSTNFGAIISHLTKLENLKYLLYPESLEESYSSCELDVMLTGFTEQFCKRMSVQLRDKDKLSAQEIALYETKRQCNSILDLTGLKRLDIKLTMSEPSSDSEESTAGTDDDDDDDDESCDEAGFQPDSIFYKTGLTKVSKLLAFDLMPNLKTKIQILLE